MKTPQDYKINWTFKQHKLSDNPLARKYAGVDYAVPNFTPFGAVRSGVVEAIENSPGGWFIAVRTGIGRDEYVHIDPNVQYAKVGDKIKKGQKLARSFINAHIHLGVLVKGRYIDNEKLKPKLLIDEIMTADTINLSEQPLVAVRYREGKEFWCATKLGSMPWVKHDRQCSSVLLVKLPVGADLYVEGKEPGIWYKSHSDDGNTWSKFVQTIK